MVVSGVWLCCARLEAPPLGRTARCSVGPAERSGRFVHCCCSRPAEPDARLDPRQPENDHRIVLDVPAVRQRLFNPISAGWASPTTATPCSWATTKHPRMRSCTKPIPSTGGKRGRSCSPKRRLLAPPCVACESTKASRAAILLRCHPRPIARIERNEIEKPHGETLRAIATRLEIEPDEIESVLIHPLAENARGCVEEAFDSDRRSSDRS